MKLRRQLKQDRRDIEARLNQKDKYRSSLKKPDHPVCQTGQSSFHRENPFLGMIKGVNA
jgi:hypothetical protein